VWLDLVTPTLEEERQVEQSLGIDVPTRDEMREIETSNRLYEDNGTLYLTTTVVYKVDTDLPETTQVTFILSGARLITNRYADLLSFRGFVTYAETHPTSCASAPLLLVGLLEAIVNRIADVLERVGGDIDTVSTRVFPRAGRRLASRNYQSELQRIGARNEKALVLKLEIHCTEIGIVVGDRCTAFNTCACALAGCDHSHSSAPFFHS